MVKFLWVRDVKAPLTPSNVVVCAWAVVPFGVISSPFLLSAVLRKHLKSYKAPPPSCKEQAGNERKREEDDGSDRGGSLSLVASEMLENTYVDNVLLQCSSVEEAREKSYAAREIFAAAGMKLRDFASNAPGFRDAIPTEWQMKEMGENNVQFKVLGIPWQLGCDRLRIEFECSHNETNAPQCVEKHRGSVRSARLSVPLTNRGQIVFSGDMGG